MNDIKFNSGTSMNFSGKPAEGVFSIFGDKSKRIEKPYTVVNFPGGHVEISRCHDDNTHYWVHIALEDGAELINARIDAEGRYVASSVGEELRATDFKHLAVLVAPKD